jgi:hypothetical protein
VAAVGELLVQSHVPGHLLLLPALPVALSEAGHVRGLRARGDIDVALAWRDGTATAVMLRFLSPHPWITGNISERADQPGFFEVAAGDLPDNREGGRATMRVATPNALRLVASRRPNTTSWVDGGDGCARYVMGGGAPSGDVRNANSHWTHNSHVGLLRVLSFPCDVSLCSSTAKPTTCERQLASLVALHSSRAIENE